MALLRPTLDYSSKDFDALEARINNLISAVFPDWSDRNKADFANIMADLPAFVGDILTKYQDNQARETRWTQAKLLKNILALVKLVGYAPPGQTAASVDETFTLAQPAAADVQILKGDTVSSLDVANPVTYQVLADTLIPAGELTVTVAVENSEFQEDSFSSTSLPNQTFALSKTPYIDGSAIIVAADGTYTQVDNFLSSGPTDRHFVVSVDSNQRATVKAGNGINGSIPQGTVDSAYKTGGGSAGRVDKNTLQKLGRTYADIHGNGVVLTCNNAAASSGGRDPATPAQIQEQAPAFARVVGRAIADEDFEIIAEQTPGVIRALMTSKGRDPAIDENSGILWIVPDGTSAAPASQALIDTVTDAFDPVTGTPTATSFNLEVRSAVYLPVNIIVTVFRAKGVTKAAAKAAVLANLAAYFAPTVPALMPDGTKNPLAGTKNPLIDFGFNLKDQNGEPTGSIAWSDIFNIIRDTKGLRKLSAATGDLMLNGARADLAIEVRQFPSLGTVQILDGDDGTTM